MKKHYLLAAFLLAASSTSFAQSAFGVKGGVNFAQESSRVDNQSMSTKLATSFHIAGYFNGRVSQGFSIQPALSLQGKGGRYHDAGEKYTDRLLYIEVPVNFLGNVRAGSGEVFFGGGPYLAYAVSARVKAGQVTYHLDLGNQSGQIKPFDAGLGLLTGYRFASGMVLSLSSSAGFVNLSNEQYGKITNNVTSISVGYEFGKR